jgi:hypothetical protein
MQEHGLVFSKFDDFLKIGIWIKDKLAKLHTTLTIRAHALRYSQRLINSTVSIEIYGVYCQFNSLYKEFSVNIVKDLKEAF